MGEISDRLLNTVTGWFDAILQAVPRVVVAILLLVLAVFIARLARKMLNVTLQKLRVDDMMVKSGLDAALRRIGVKKLSDALPMVVYVLLLFIFAGAASDALGLTGVSTAIGTVLGYLPNVAAALLLVVFGAWGAQVAGKATAAAAEGSGLEFGPSLGRLVSTSVFFIVALTAASQLKIDTEVIRIFTLCGLAGIALAFGLSLGLGSRRVMENILTGFYARKLFRAGDEVRIGETEGILVGITSTQALIERGADTIVVPNTAFLEDAITLRAKVHTSIPADAPPPEVTGTDTPAKTSI